MRSNVLIIGLGVSGKASACLCLKKGFQVSAVDQKEALLRNDPETKLLLQRGLLLLPDDPRLALDPFSLIVVSPGIEPSHPLLQKGKELGIEIIGEIELALRSLPNRHLLGVTGSNGKTTTVLLTEHILKAAGIKAVALGNVGAALSGYAMDPDPDEILIIELSSFQLETMQLAPRFDVGMVLNITPNHLNRHASMEEYAAAKLRLGASIKEGGQFYISATMGQEYRSLCPPNTRYYDAPEFPRGQRNVRYGVPEWENVQAARLLCSFCGIEEALFERGLANFKKPPHRLEWIAEIAGVAYYNDSKASNVAAVIHAVRQFDKPIVLIAGGVDKGSSYCPWIEQFLGKVKKIVVFGQAAPKMERELATIFPLEKVTTLSEALEQARLSAVQGDTVLFSPGCSSYDQFVNYEERGNTFRELVLWIEKKLS